MPRESLGEVEHMVLVAVLRLRDDAYGVPIMDEIARRTGREISKAAIYIALRRLEEKGLLTSSLGEATPERGGRAKRFFKLTKAGARQLRDAREALMRMWANVEHLVHRAAR
jgi:DNA-binding PadR family transcriptional regulator